MRDSHIRCGGAERHRRIRWRPPRRAGSPSAAGGPPAATRAPRRRGPWGARRQDHGPRSDAGQSAPDGGRGTGHRPTDHRGAVLGGAFGEQPYDVRPRVIHTTTERDRYAIGTLTARYVSRSRPHRTQTCLTAAHRASFPSPVGRASSRLRVLPRRHQARLGSRAGAGASRVADQRARRPGRKQTEMPGAGTPAARSSSCRASSPRTTPPSAPTVPSRRSALGPDRFPRSPSGPHRIAVRATGLAERTPVDSPSRCQTSHKSRIASPATGQLPGHMDQFLDSDGM